jgi:hypothetical protein
MKYTTSQAVQICTELEPILAEKGYHAAIGGSLAYRGTSNKDIDILLYPHNNSVETDRYILVDLLEKYGYSTSYGDGTKVPDVHRTENKQGWRVEFFFMRRGDYTLQN